MKVLLVSVGGTPEPIKKSIKYHEPDFIYFICSQNRPDQKGSCSQVKDILKEVDFDPQKTELIEIERADSFSEVFSKVIKLIHHLKKTQPNAQLLVDYSGGTKTMSVGMALAGIEEGLNVYFVSGARPDLSKVQSGTELIHRIEVEDYMTEKFFSTAEALWQNYFYQSAASLTEKFMQAVSEDKREKLRLLYYISKAFGLWDRFQHDLAYEILHQYGRFEKIRDYLKILYKLSYCVDEEKGEARDYFIVMDLLLNAERRVEEYRFEDAIGRIYRALELLAQIRLFKEYGIKTGEAKPEEIPESIREEYIKKFQDEDGLLKIPLFAAHNLLYHLQDEVWKDWLPEKKKLILDFLQLRNFSFYAHGLKALGEADFKKAIPMMSEVKEMVMKLQPETKNFPQLPRSIKELEIKELEF